MKAQALEKLTKELEAITNSVPEKNPHAEIMKYQATILIREIMKRCAASNALCEDVLQDHKSWKRCMKYVTGKAKEMAIGNIACIPDATVFEWAEDYFHLDDKAEVEEEMAKLKKQEEEREKRKQEEAEKTTLAREKAIEKLSLEEGWAELSEDEQQNKITEEARKIKINLGRKKKPTESKKTSKKTASANNTKEEVTSEKDDSLEKEISKKKEVVHPDPENDGYQMDIFSMM